MQLEWHDLAAAFALYLVIEGVLPFLNPQGMKRAMAVFSSMPDPRLRTAGFVMMISGLVLLWLVRS